jgi:hypothetical protein
MFRRVISTLCFGTLAIGSAGLIGGCVYHHPTHEVIVERDCPPPPVVVEHVVVEHDGWHHRGYHRHYPQRYRHW